MKHYRKLLELGCFTRETVRDITGNDSTAGTVLYSYIKRGLVKRVRRNLYVAVDLASEDPIASKFRIGSSATKSAYVSHHTAFEYHGCANQVSYQVEVSSDTPFTTFDFNGNTYAYLASRIKSGVLISSDNVRVTDIERTVLDGINDFEKIMGLEELLRCLALVPTLKEERLLEYLFQYGKQALYQKAGFILENFAQELNISESFFAECLFRIGKSTRYLAAAKGGVYNKRWQLVAPEHLMELVEKGVNSDADV